MSRFRDDAPPWSFFIPVTLAVIVGVLAADAIRYAIGSVFGGGVMKTNPEGEAAANAAADAAAEAERARVAPTMGPTSASGPPADPAPGDVVDTVDAPAVPQEQRAVAGETSRSGDVLELPDSMSARRDGDPAACVNGTVVNRVAGGWEQAVEGDAPIPCVTVSR